jgi:nitroreductase
MDFQLHCAHAEVFVLFSKSLVKRETIKDILLDAIESPSSSNTLAYKVAIADGATCKQLGQELLARYYKINKIQRQPLALEGNAFHPIIL